MTLVIQLIVLSEFIYTLLLFILQVTLPSGAEVTVSKAMYFYGYLNAFITSSGRDFENTEGWFKK